jgi:hypothetical protein
MDNQACCSHSKVDRITIDHPGGTQSERWICPDCSTNFWPEGVDMHIKKRRDKFAAAALTGMLSKPASPQDIKFLESLKELPVEFYTRIAIGFADALLRELEKKE